MDYLNRLNRLSLDYQEALSRHSVLKNYWSRLSLILKGSTARGFADEYSDLDFVIFTDSATYGQIVADYIAQGLSARRDGIFLPLGDWEGHYNLDTYDRLREYFDRDNIVNIWEYVNVRVMHDPEGVYGKILEEKLSLFHADMDRLIQKQYLELQLQLDWMRQLLRRADAGAALLYGAAFWQACCRLLYLLNGRPYPCDKWLLYYLEELPAYQPEVAAARSYPASFPTLANLPRGRDLAEYPLYAKGEALAGTLAAALRRQYGDAPWIGEWYLYA